MDTFSEAVNGPRVGVKTIHIWQTPEGVWLGKATFTLPDEARECMRALIDALNHGRITSTE